MLLFCVLINFGAIAQSILVTLLKFNLVDLWHRRSFRSCSFSFGYYTG